MTKTVLILGASGKIGRHAATAFQAAGWTVRLYDRKRGDMTAQAMGAQVIVNGLNPPNYHNWATIIPEITRQVIAAARASDAMVVIPGNVYNFGDTPGTWDEHTPQRPVSRKGKIRVEMEQAFRDAGVKTLILRAGNFIDPDRNGCVMSAVTLAPIKRGKVTSMGDPDVRQAWTYLPDWARAVVMLCEKAPELATFEDVPFPGHAFTSRELAAQLSTTLGRKIKVAPFMWWLMRITSPVWELARELMEMRYLSNTDHALSGEKFARLLPNFEPAPMATAMTCALPREINPNKGVAGHLLLA